MSHYYIFYHLNQLVAIILHWTNQISSTKVNPNFEINYPEIEPLFELISL